MDVEKCLAEFLAAIESGDYSAAAEHGAAVAEWVENGGYPPSAIADIAADLSTERDSVFPFAADSFDDSFSMEFRLFVRPEGTTELCCGPSDYDVDHRGFCGAGSVGPGDDSAAVLAAVLAAFSDCVDTIAQQI